MTTPASPAPAEPIVDPRRPSDPKVASIRHAGDPLKRFLLILGPGFVTGASDDDPSGIGTYAQAGASFGNTINAGADIGAIAAAINLLLPVPALAFVIPVSR